MLVDIGRLRDAEQIVSGIVKHADLMSVYLALEAIGDTDAERTIGQRVRERARKRHGAVIDKLTDALDREVEARRVTLLRSRVTDPDLRFFLGLLLVVPTAAALRRLIALRTRGTDYATTVVGWLAALDEMQAFPFRLDAGQLRMIELMIRGKTFTQIKQALHGDAKALRASYEQLKATPYVDRLVARAT
jgi:hypothetical protein